MDSVLIFYNALVSSFFSELLQPLIDGKKISGALIIAVPSGKYRYTPEKGTYFCIYFDHLGSTSPLHAYALL